MRYSHELFLKELGVRLRHLRKERGLTLRDMIATHGFHLSHWQGVEKGKGIAVASLLRVCEAFDLPLETLIAGLGVVVAEEASAAPTVAAAAVQPPSLAVRKRAAKATRAAAATPERSPASPRPRPRLRTP